MQALQPPAAALDRLVPAEANRLWQDYDAPFLLLPLLPVFSSAGSPQAVQSRTLQASEGGVPGSNPSPAQPLSSQLFIPSPPTGPAGGGNQRAQGEDASTSASVPASEAASTIACASASTEASGKASSAASAGKYTVLMPCRVAVKGSFPLNGTYFQPNEVFLDEATLLLPLQVAPE